MMEDDRLKQTLESLRYSTFRSGFGLGTEERNTLLDKGLGVIREHAVEFITKRIASAFPEKDGKQTPWKGHPVFVAQHATATCCRACIQKWHGIEKGRALTEEEIEFLVGLIVKWIENNADGENEI